MASLAQVSPDTPGLIHKFEAPSSTQALPADRSPRTAPVPQDRLNQCQRCNRSGVRAEDAGPKRNSNDLRQLAQDQPLLFGKATLRANQNGERLNRTIPDPDQRGDRIRHVGVFIAKYQEAAGVFRIRLNGTGSATCGIVKTPHCWAA